MLLCLPSALCSLKQLGGHWRTEIKDAWNPAKSWEQPGPQLFYAALTNDYKHRWINKNVLSPRSGDWKSNSHLAKNVLLDDRVCCWPVPASKSYHYLLAKLWLHPYLHSCIAFPSVLCTISSSSSFWRECVHMSLFRAHILNYRDSKPRLCLVF